MEKTGHEESVIAEDEKPVLSGRHIFGELMKFSEKCF
jgi:hypothetical protein